MRSPRNADLPPASCGSGTPPASAVQGVHSGRAWNPAAPPTGAFWKGTVQDFVAPALPWQTSTSHAIAVAEDDAEDHDAREPATASDVQVSSPDRGRRVPRRTIVHVDDLAEDAHLMREALAANGAAVTYRWMADGADAMAFIDELSADRATEVVFLLDVNLPGVDGIDLVRHVRAQPALRRASVIMLSTSEQQTDRDLAREYGASSYLVKPSRFDGWIALAQHLERGDA